MHTKQGGVLWTAGVNAIEDECSQCQSNPNAAGVYPDIAPFLKWDDRNKYLNTDYLIGGDMQVSVSYDAGSGHTVNDTFGGVKFFLRLIDKSTGVWISQHDIIAEDNTAIGQRAGTATATFLLAGLTPSAELPEDQFYFVFIQFESTNGSKKSVGVQPLNLIEPTPASIQWDNINKYRNTPYLNNDYLDVTLNVQAGTGQTVTSGLQGVTLLLRELRSDWSVVKDVTVTDASLLGELTGEITLSVPLFDLTPSAQLPEGNFYFLFARFKSSDGKVYAATASPVIIDGDFDGDQVGDLADTDDDNDGVADSIDAFPFDPFYGVLGDFDGDQDVDRFDLAYFVRRIKDPLQVRSQFDFDGDGQVHRNDVRALRNLCTRARCAD